MQSSPNARINSYPTFLGIDWGPINSENSRTVMAVINKRGNIRMIMKYDKRAPVVDGVRHYRHHAKNNKSKRESRVSKKRTENHEYPREKTFWIKRPDKSHTKRK